MCVVPQGPPGLDGMKVSPPALSLVSSLRRFTLIATNCVITITLISVRFVVIHEENFNKFI